MFSFYTVNFEVFSMTEGLDLHFKFLLAQLEE